MEFGISAEAGLRHHFAKHPHRVAASHLQVSTILLLIMYPNVLRREEEVAGHVARDPN